MLKKNGKVSGVVVVRSTSNRLPNKAMREILGRETIALLIERVKRCRRLDSVILAASTDPSDDVLETVANREGILAFRGSLANPGLRIYEAVQEYGGDHIVRITGDDILRDELMIDRAVQIHLEGISDVTFMKNMPYGTSSEIFNFKTLETIVEKANVPENTEYLTWYLENENYFNSQYIDSGYIFDPNLRMTLDYEEDFRFFMCIFENFYLNNPCFTLPEVLQWLQKHPEIIEVNKIKSPKLSPKDLDVSLNI